MSVEYKNNWHEKEASKNLYERLNKDTIDNPKAFIYPIDYPEQDSQYMQMCLVRFFPRTELGNIL